MGNLINLNRFRKQKAGEAHRNQAETNRRLHGRTAAERSQETANKSRLDKLVDGARLTGDSAPESSGDDAPADSEETP